MTNAEFAAFVGGGGYRRREFWDDEGWRWREQAGAEHPVYWQPLAVGRWLSRVFDQWVPLRIVPPADPHAESMLKDVMQWLKEDKEIQQNWGFGSVKPCPASIM